MDSTECFSSKSFSSISSETVELKFNILLLLRNRYSNGIRDCLINDAYRTVFGKDINKKIFNPLANHSAKYNILDGDIQTSKKGNEIFFHAKNCCSDDEMQFIAEAVSSYKISTNNYVRIKTEIPVSDYFNENDGEFALDEPDPLTGSMQGNYVDETDDFEDNSTFKSEDNDTIQIKTEDTEELSLSYESPEEYIPSPSSAVDPSHLIPLIAYQIANSHPPKVIRPATKPKNFPKPTSSTKSNNKEIPNKNKTVTDRHYCSYKGCKKYYRRPKMLADHIRLVHDKNVLMCSTENCELMFSDKRLLIHHEQRCKLKTHHCKWKGCDRTFRTSKLLHGHRSAVHRKMDIPTFKCTVTPGCASQFRTPEILQTHEMRCRFKFETMQEIEGECVSEDDESLSTQSPEEIIII